MNNLVCATDFLSFLCQSFSLLLSFQQQRGFTVMRIRVQSPLATPNLIARKQ
jgi:hypothetical protein